jgi:hypothetical protein
MIASGCRRRRACRSRSQRRWSGRRQGGAFVDVVSPGGQDGRAGGWGAHRHGCRIREDNIEGARGGQVAAPGEGGAGRDRGSGACGADIGSGRHGVDVIASGELDAGAGRSDPEGLGGGVGEISGKGRARGLKSAANIEAERIGRVGDGRVRRQSRQVALRPADEGEVEGARSRAADVGDGCGATVGDRGDAADGDGGGGALRPGGSGRSGGARGARRSLGPCRARGTCAPVAPC